MTFEGEPKNPTNEDIDFDKLKNMWDELMKKDGVNFYSNAAIFTETLYDKNDPDSRKGIEKYKLFHLLGGSYISPTHKETAIYNDEIDQKIKKFIEDEFNKLEEKK